MNIRSVTFIEHFYPFIKPKGLFLSTFITTKIVNFVCARNTFATTLVYYF